MGKQVASVQEKALVGTPLGTATVGISQASIGVVLALCEDAPMAGIGIYFFVQKHPIPPFQVTHLCRAAHAGA